MNQQIVWQEELNENNTDRFLCILELNDENNEDFMLIKIII